MVVSAAALALRLYEEWGIAKGKLVRVRLFGSGKPILVSAGECCYGFFTEGFHK